jgi:hypothetical protein
MVLPLDHQAYPVHQAQSAPRVPGVDWGLAVSRALPASRARPDPQARRDYRGYLERPGVLALLVREEPRVNKGLMVLAGVVVLAADKASRASRASRVRREQLALQAQLERLGRWDRLEPLAREVRWGPLDLPVIMVRGSTVRPARRGPQSTYTSVTLRQQRRLSCASSPVYRKEA